ncbi:hypothetical protein AB0K18_04555 [Nonomuraea sp. NPDC049421]|uniref:hypothetical protein n=1 Tax=Nonomuraea sp. NPDC049421 TaxID=3155275 RepID=UPI00343A4FBF
MKTFLEEAGHPGRLLGLIADAADWQYTRRAVAATVERFGALHGAVAKPRHLGRPRARRPRPAGRGRPRAEPAENLRLHAIHRGVGVTLVNPGIIDTPFWMDGEVPPFALPPGPVAEAICHALGRPDGVDLNTITVRPIGRTA